MAGITLAQAEAQLAAWLAADAAVAKNQEYEIAGRRYKRADAEQIRNNIAYWSDKVDLLASPVAARSGPRVRGVTPS